LQQRIERGEGKRSEEIRNEKGKENQRKLKK
jgi:hypothetical protein